jgi:hypothetical protein
MGSGRFGQLREKNSMTNKKDSGAADQRTTRDTLVELVEALDRRVPHVERLGERRIALEAAHLRKQARTRLTELESAAADRRAGDTADAVMTDDGGPVGGACKR